MSIEIVPAQFSTVGLTGYISAGTTNASLGTVVFSNSNGVSFGMNAGIVTASVVAGAAAGIGAAGAGSQTQTSGTLVFSNSNNISFGMSNSSIVTASYSQSNQTGNFYVSGNTTQLSSTAGLDLRSVSFEGAGNVSIGVSNGRVLVSGAGGAGGGIAAAAGTQTQTSGTLAFVNSNGISFGMSNSSQITASYTVPTQTVQTQNLHNATVSGNSTSSGVTGYAQISSGTMTLVGGNNITIRQDGNRIELSGANAGGAQTGISSVALSNTTYTSGQISFSDANGISFGTGAGQAINITHGLQYTSATSAITSNALHSSASKVEGIIAGTNSAGGTATLTGNVSFSNANGISFYTSAGNAVVGTVRTDYQSAGAYLTTAAQSDHSHNFATTTTNGSLVVVATTNSAGATVAVPPYITTYAAQTNQTANLYVSGNTTQLSSTAGLDLRSISFEGAGIASVGVSNGRVLVSVPSGGGVGDGVNIIRAGTVGTTGTTFSASTGTININGGNNITVSQDGSNNIVISAAQGGIAAGTQTATSGTLVFANSNGVTFGMSGSSQITASVAAAGGAQTGISSVALSNTTYTSGQISFRDGNNISFASGTGQAVSITHNLQSAGAYLTTARASNDAIGLNTALTANGLSVTANSSGLSINVPAWLTTAAQSDHSHNFATTTTNGSLMVVATTNSAGATVAVPPYITTYAAQSNQTANFYVSGNSTQLSSTAGVDLRSVSFEGAGVASVGVSNGRILISVPSGGGAGDGYNIVYAGTAGTTGTTWSSASASVRINGGNNITVSQNGSNDIVISAAQGGIAAGTQTATSGTLVFANSNGVTFGMSGSSQITASVNAGGGATVGGWEPIAPSNNSTFSSLGQNSVYMQKLIPEQNYSGNNFELRMSGSFVSSTNSQVAAHTFRYGLYSLDTANNSYNSIATSSLFINASFNSSSAMGFTVSQGAGSYTVTSNNSVLASLMTGFKHLYLPFTTTLTAGGLYAFAIHHSSATTVGTSPLRIAIWNQSIVNNLTVGKVYASTLLASNASYVGDYNQGVYSTTTGAMPAAVALSQLTNAISQMRLFLQLEV